jgi:hypothetical protein
MDRSPIPAPAALDRLDDAARAVVLKTLDEMSRPMTHREIEDALRATAGPMSRSERRRVIRALSPLSIIAITPREGA